MNGKKMGLGAVMMCMIVLTFIPVLSMAESASFSKADILSRLEGYREPAELAESLSTSGMSVYTTAAYDEIYDLYKSYQGEMRPVFITTDLLFHTVHKVFDYSLRVTETEQFPKLQAFSKEMFNATLRLKEEFGKDKNLAIPADQLAAYFAVPNMLLGNDIKMENSLKKKVDGETELIRKHKGFSFSKILSQKEDYSQYIVRGHYIRNETLEKYFLASMWYGRRMFRFDESIPGGAGLPADTPDIKGWYKTASADFHEIAKTEILAGCLLVYLLEHTKIENKLAIEDYKALKAPFDRLVGRSEDITVEALSEAIRGTFGKDWKPDDLVKDIQTLYDMAKKLATANKPEIDSTGLGRKGLTLFGQRFILDSAFFQKLVHNKDDNALPYTQTDSKEKPFTWVMDQVSGAVRGFPRGLDIMAILGSETAYAILKDGGDTDYENYDNNLKDLKTILKEKDLKSSKNTYEKILYSLMPLFQTNKDIPGFMRSDLWKKKCLNTALGAWTELRHDTILYGKQSYTPVMRGMPPQIRWAYLEPNPQIYERLRSVVYDLYTFIDSRKPLLGKYKSLAQILGKLVNISEKELKGAMPDGEDAAFLGDLSSRLQSITEVYEEGITGESDSYMPLVADVHTRMPEALTEAVGFPAKIIVVIPVKNKPMLFFGGVYSYYEFKVPYEKRLTDEKWMKELKTGKYEPFLTN